ncbi:acyltransferase [Candidatus Roizmanbacteria bacterium]|nr:acyltransferase [Candidatus Roizmanbacteria bacterium]
MNLVSKIIANISSLPARWKGMKFGKNSFIAPGYDWINVGLKGVRLGDTVIIGRNAWIQTIDHEKTDACISIGNNTQVGRFVVLSALFEIRIGENCLISYNVSVYDHDHNIADLRSPFKAGLTKAEKVVIGDECFIGAHSFILKGVRLGKHCAVGANSVVTKSFPSYSVIAGNPAKLIRKLK